MLVSFVIDPRGLHLDSGLGTSRTAHERLLRLWARLGVLICASPESAVHSRIRALPQELRKLWMTALKTARFRIDARVGSLELATCVAEVVPLAAATQVVFCGADLADACGLGADDALRIDPPGLEIVRVSSSDASGRFRESEDLANRPIDEGTHPETTWRERFDVLARSSRTIVVIDRYAAQRAWNAKKRSWDGDSGIARFIRHAAAVTGTPDLFLYTAVPEVGATSFFDYVGKTIQELGPSAPRTTVRLARDDFGGIAHGRSIRFDRLLCEVDLGLEVFEGEACYRLSSFTLKPVTAEHRRLEERLRNVTSEQRAWEVQESLS